MKRLFLIVLDSVGIGALPDAEKFGDAGADTMGRISESKNFCVPNLLSLGLGNIEGLGYLGAAQKPLAAHGRCAERSMGKDTTIGHWEIAGLVSEVPLPTYPCGFPEDVISAFEKATGRGVLCNKPYSGTDVIRDYGEEHLRTGALIVYTSGDSVFQIAAHEAVVPVETLYEYCRAARKILTGKHGVGRVIARPFTGEPGAFTRTADRRDFSLEPHGATMADELAAAGLDVISVGKISDIFAGRGITEAVTAHGNEEGMAAAMALAERDFNGLCFINLVDFDMKYGHRNDIDGYAAALSRFDAWLPGFTAKLGDDDLLIITADHGCDPGDASTDHTREYTPLLAFGKGVKPAPLGTRASFADIAATAEEFFGVKGGISGESFLADITG
ncbi:MAG: phosphopentomutase [Clostridia bacterium]|nr:phosphopentomutase [Clostridia bacterium]